MFANVFSGPFKAPFGRIDTVATLPWYRSGGAPQPIAAYCPKGAASLAASYVNLANPGTYDAAPGVAPTWDAATGWTFNGSTQYLTTGITPNAGWSAICLFSDYIINQLFGHGSSGQPLFGIIPSASGQVNYRNGNNYSVMPNLTAGVLAIAGQSGYRNGLLDTSAIPTRAGTWQVIYIGANNNGGVANTLLKAKIQAIAIYNTTISAGEVAAISSAMSLL